MRKVILLLIFFHLSPIAWAQKKTNTETASYSYDVSFGNKIYNNSFYSQLNTFTKADISIPTQFIGIGISGAFWAGSKSKSFKYDGHIYFNQIVPQKIRLNDTLAPLITGNCLSMGFGKDLLSKTNTVDIIISGGFNMGRIRLYGKEITNQKNFYFSPKISIQPKVKIKSISFSIRGDYEYDISNPNWKKLYFSKENPIILNKFNQSGLSLFFCVGYIID